MYVIVMMMMMMLRYFLLHHPLKVCLKKSYEVFRVIRGS